MRGTIRQRGKGRWQVQVYAGRDIRTGKERRVARTIRGTRSDADHALRQLIREVEAGQHRGDDPTVAELAEQWHAYRSADWTPPHPPQLPQRPRPVGAAPPRRHPRRRTLAAVAAMAQAAEGPPCSDDQR